MTRTKLGDADIAALEDIWDAKRKYGERDEKIARCSAEPGERVIYVERTPVDGPVRVVICKSRQVGQTLKMRLEGEGTFVEPYADPPTRLPRTTR